MCYSALVKRDLKKYGDGISGAHWVREDLDCRDQRTNRNPKLFPPYKNRFFPGDYAPIIHQLTDGSMSISPMRYGVYQSDFIQDPKIAKAFNARRDNLLAPYWSNAFGVHHGVILLGGFYEWVNVSHLLKAGVVTIAEIKAQFEKKTEARRQRILVAGKKYAMTPTEKKDPRFRKIIIEFRPDDDTEVFVPVLFTEKTLADGHADRGFAIVTYEPQHEVSAAGHDRSPAFVTIEAVINWVNTRDRGPWAFQPILDRKPTKVFAHQLVAEAA